MAVRRRERAIAIALASALAALPSGAGAQEEGTRLETRVGTYADADRTQVGHAHAAGRLAIGPARIGAAYVADIVSSASVDVVSRATRAMRETRHQVMADAAWVGDRGALVSGAWAGSFEADRESEGGILRGGLDLDRARLWHGTLVLGGTWSRIGTVLDPRVREEAVTAQGSVALARILDRSTVLRVSGDASATRGFQSSLYRTVRLGDWTAQRNASADPDALAWLFTGVTGVARERHPDLRVRARLGLEFARDLGGGVALVLRGAGYVDDWGIVAGEVSGEVRWEPARDLLVRLGARGYLQTAAWFWRRRYLAGNDVAGFRTADPDLGPMNNVSLLAGVTVPFDDLVLDARLEGLRWGQPEFDLRPERYALSFLVGMTWVPASLF